MGERKASPVAPRLKREDYNRTCHDSAFSKWQILIGPKDWEEHSNGKEGVARYRVHNLPHRSCPGLYELGATAANLQSGVDAVLDDVIATYIGQADNVRSRIQCYGRSGSHLGKNETCDLFEQIFSRGFSIVYRWAPMRNKSAAEKTEAELLNFFDYAWNSGRNGVRRQDDVLEKLVTRTSNSYRRFPGIAGMLRFFTFGKAVGIRIKKGSKISNQSDALLADVFKTSRSRPKLVQDKSESRWVQCGVILKDGTCCKKPSVEGRKRCSDHKGRKKHGFDAKACGFIHRNGEICKTSAAAGRKRCEEHKGMRVKFSTASIKCDVASEGIASQEVKAWNSYGKGSPPPCGTTLKNGSFCTRDPGRGNSKCWQHR